MIFYIKKNKKPIAFLKTALYNGERRRGVAQLVEHYLREVGAACSNHVTPTNKNRSVERFFVAHFLNLFDQMFDLLAEKRLKA